jgi:hypothetical protein
MLCHKAYSGNTTFRKQLPQRTRSIVGNGTVVKDRIRESVPNKESSGMITLEQVINNIHLKEGYIMRTTATLQKAVTYLNGAPIYNGNVDRVYTSALFVSLQVHLVRAPQGAKVENPANDELKQVVKRLKPGQIGALKEVEQEQVLGSEPFLELLIPCDRSNTIAIAEVCRDLAKPQNVTGGMTCTINSNQMPVEQAKELLTVHRDNNREIQARWIEFVRTERAKMLSSAAKLQQKSRIYNSYVSLTEYTFVVTGLIRHVVNNPDLKSTVFSNADSAYYESVNYTTGNSRVRKTAQEKLPIVSIPIVTNGDYKRVISQLELITTKSDILKKIKGLGGEVVFHEGGIFGDSNIDWDNLKGLDNIARVNQITD